MDNAQAQVPPCGPGPASAGSKVYHCGPLSYTLRGLIVLFGWLLWGDFCFTLMETVGPSVLPLKLKALGVSNTLMSVIMSTLPGVLNMTVCPWVSFRSDRHRSRLGRRIPFILWTMPFLALCLVLVGWSDALAPCLQRVIPPLGRVAPVTITIALIGIFYVAFQFFNMFVGSVYWYLFNDVVPPQFLGRFMGLFRLVGTGAGSLYSYFVFKYAETNMREILTGGALLYFAGFGLMCLMVKEGPYPPPPDEVPPRGVTGIVKAFGKQSFSSKFYWYFYLMNAFAAAAGACGLFGVFFSKQMGLTLDQMGKLGAYGGIASLVATYFTAVFVDRWHPLRISAYNAVFGAVTGFGGWIWVTMTLPGDVYFWLSLGGLLVFRFGAVLADGCGIPLFMRLMPKSLYGQFSAANALIRSFANILAGLLAGLFMDAVKRYYGGSDFAYRWIFVWPWVLGSASAVFCCLGYREWKRLGGDDNYRPPAPWTESGFEEVADKVKSHTTKPRLVMVSMWLGLLGAAVNVLLVLLFMHYMRLHHLSRAWLWYAQIFLPIKLLLTAAAYAQLVHVRRDIADCERGARTRFGLPHHGVLLVNAIQGLVYFPVFWYQTAKMIELNFQRELILFGIASLLSTAAAIVGVQIIRWIERAPAAPDPGWQPAARVRT
jgi:Na+/melibiose symporter-like transporter